MQVTIVEPGAFATPGFTHGMPVLPAHPAYTKPELGSNLIRNDFSSRDPLSLSDPMMAVKRIYEMSQLPEPPLRFLIGKDAVAVSRTQLKSIKEDTDKYESWSEGLEFVRET